jgi:hypothetical protein
MVREPRSFQINPSFQYKIAVEGSQVGGSATADQDFGDWLRAPLALMDS